MVATWRSIIVSLRPLHWSKNLLLAIPLLLGHQIMHPAKLWALCWAILAFCCCASAGYLLNDWLDQDSDRLHRSKSRRPVAAGELSSMTVSVLIGLLIIVAVSIAASLSELFLMILLGYFCLTVAYSLRLKCVAIIDVVILGALHTLRLLAGGVSTETSVSPWLLTFAVFIFTSLAFVKRYVEIDTTASLNSERLGRRGYSPSDRDFIRSVGPTCGYLAVLVLALYLNSSAVTEMYTSPYLLWLVCPLVFYWISRVWLLAERGELHEDPVVFAATDKVTYLSAFGVALIVFAAI